MAKQNKEPPGFYSYKEAYPIVKKMSVADLGRYYLAKYQYWVEGVYPEFSHYDKPDVAETMWTLEQGKLDNDRLSYYVRGVKKMYAAYSRDHKDEDGNPDKSLLEWYGWKKRIIEIEGPPNIYFDMVTEMDLLDYK